MPTKASINSRGGITIPVAMRRALGLKPRDVVLIEVTERGLLVRSPRKVPIEIYSEKRIAEFAEADRRVRARRRQDRQAPQEPPLLKGARIRDGRP